MTGKGKSGGSQRERVDVTLVMKRKERALNDKGKN